VLAHPYFAGREVWQPNLIRKNATAVDNAHPVCASPMPDWSTQESVAVPANDL
jgi:hypothetical protein